VGVLCFALRHYQARTLESYDRKEEQQGYKYPCCVDNDDNAVADLYHDFLKILLFKSDPLLLNPPAPAVKHFFPEFFSGDRSRHGSLPKKTERAANLSSPAG
jgi:hypothetical protein